VLHALAKAMDLPGQRELLREFVKMIGITRPDILKRAENILRLEKEISGLKNQ
jgi:hypothetical protein